MSTALRMPRLAIAVALLVLAALAGTMSYAGFLVVGVVADLLGTGRVIAGLLLGLVFARVPSLANGKLHTVGLLTKPARRPLMVGLFALCMLNFLAQGPSVAALVTGVAMVFLLAYPWLRKALFDRMSASVFRFAAGRPAPARTDDTVIDGEFREKKE